MNAKRDVKEALETKEKCSVVIVYEDVATRQRAISACDYLRQQLWSEVEFDFHWWRADFLEHAVMAHTAAEQAADSDFLIFSFTAGGVFSPALKEWFESWIGDRHGRDGAMLDLTTTGLTQTGGATNSGNYLREVARRAMFDYFATFPQTATGTLPASFEEAELWAGQGPSVLDEILQQSPRPPSFGLND